MGGSRGTRKDETVLTWRQSRLGRLCVRRRRLEERGEHLRRYLRRQPVALHPLRVGLPYRVPALVHPGLRHLLGMGRRRRSRGAPHRDCTAVGRLLHLHRSRADGSAQHAACRWSSIVRLV